MSACLIVAACDASHSGTRASADGATTGPGVPRLFSVWHDMAGLRSLAGGLPAEVACIADIISRAASYHSPTLSDRLILCKRRGEMVSSHCFTPPLS
jgi:hypothetical protein